MKRGAAEGFATSLVVAANGRVAALNRVSTVAVSTIFALHARAIGHHFPCRWGFMFLRCLAMRVYVQRVWRRGACPTGGGLGGLSRR